MTEVPLYLKIADLQVALYGWTASVRPFVPFLTEPEEGVTEDVRVDFSPSGTENDWLRLHRLMAEALIPKGVLLFHASAVALDGEGYAFTAPSGTGKSTHAAFWKERFGERVRYVNDDKPFLVIRDRGVFIAGSPWMGKHGLGENVTVPLRGIAFLRRGSKNRTERLAAEDGCTELMKQVYLPGSGEKIAAVLSMIERIGTEVPFYGLQCLPDVSAADEAYGVMGRSGS